MATYTFPNPAGGSMTVQAGDFASAQQAAAQQGWTPSMGTFGSNTGPDVAGVSYAGQPSGASPTVSNTANQSSMQQLGSQINSLLGAIASGNKQAFDEAVRQFNVSFGLDQSKFTEAIRQFNENLAIAQSGVTGTFQGAPTMQAQAQYAQLFGTNAAPLPGQQTLAANQQAYAQQLGAIQTAAGLQANPFRQAQVMGQLGNVLRGQGVAGFQAPGQATGQTDFSGMGNMQRLIDDIRGGPGAINSQSTQSVLDAIPTPTKLDSVNFYRSSPVTQNLVLQGMQEKYGLSPDDALAQIKNTLPQFQSPTTFGGVRR
jgi:hypothetical protein